MAILKKRCPRCKRETKVHAVYSRSDYGNKVMKPIVGRYQCSVCGLCFKFRPAKPPLGKKLNLHQAYEGTDSCIYCGKFVIDWKPLEVCSGGLMEPEPDCLSPQHVKARLQEIIEALKDHRDIDVPEEEIRELQHFFNERSAVFLREARSELKALEARKRRYRCVPAVLYNTNNDNDEVKELVTMSENEGKVN